MKKKIVSVAIVAAVAVAAAWNFNQQENNDTLADLTLNNIEALADVESSLSCYSWGCRLDYLCSCHVYVFGGYVQSCSGYRG